MIKQKVNTFTGIISYLTIIWIIILTVCIKHNNHENSNDNNNVNTNNNNNKSHYDQGGKKSKDID